MDPHGCHTFGQSVSQTKGMFGFWWRSKDQKLKSFSLYLKVALLQCYYKGIETAFMFPLTLAIYFFFKKSLLEIQSLKMRSNVFILLENDIWGRQWLRIHLSDLSWSSVRGPALGFHVVFLFILDYKRSRKLYPKSLLQLLIIKAKCAFMIP